MLTSWIKLSLIGQVLIQSDAQLSHVIDEEAGLLAKFSGAYYNPNVKELPHLDIDMSKPQLFADNWIWV